MRPRVLDCVLGALIVCHHACSGFALSTARRSHLADGTSETQYLFLVHHKTGTALNLKLAFDMSNVLRIPRKSVPWASVMDASNSLLGKGTALAQTAKEHTQGEKLLDTVTSIGCTGQVMLYEDMRAPLLDQILKTCPGTRAVHLVRRPSSIVASDYAYTKDLKPGEERQRDFERGENLRNHSLAWGVEEECNTYFRDYHIQMLEVHQMIQAENLDNILEVRLEDFEANYDSTTRSIFEHLLGSDHPSIDELVKKAIKYDISRMDKGSVASNEHISGRTEKAEVEMEMTRLLEKGDSCIKKLGEADTLMGYTEL
mmetsp:Transcript_117736/g.240732  ORF Transcript_117736/g.240732 Transcript_117736/m.240732 type:complete len:314 (-) Transcript_117736:71-1012(-)